MNPGNELIPRGEFRVMDSRVDPIDETGMNQVEAEIFTWLFNELIPVEKVALRILSDTYVVAVRLKTGRSLTLTFDAKHIPGIITRDHRIMIAKGLIDHYREHVLSEQPKKYATARRDGYDVPLIGIPPEAGPSSGDFREDPNPQ